MGSGLVGADRVVEGIEDLLAVLLLFHIDEIDNDDPADIPKAQLVGDLLHRLQVGLQNRLFEIALPDEPAGVDVNHRQRFSMIDNDVSSRFQPDPPILRLGDFHLKTVDVVNRLILIPELHTGRKLGR